MSKHQDQRVQKAPINRPVHFPNAWCPCIAHRVARDIERNKYGQPELNLKGKKK